MLSTVPSKREHLADKYFNCSQRERVVFEAGIKLGTIYHQFVGTPLSSTSVESLEKAIQDGVRVQPFVKDVKVHISRDALRRKSDEYDYQTLTGPMMEVDPHGEDGRGDGHRGDAVHRGAALPAHVRQDDSGRVNRPL